MMRVYLHRIFDVTDQLSHVGEEGRGLEDVLLAQPVLLNEPGIVYLGELSVPEKNNSVRHLYPHILYSPEQVLNKQKKKTSKISQKEDMLVSPYR